MATHIDSSGLVFRHPLTTETDARLENDTGGPIVNDVVRFNIFAPDQISPLPGALLVLDVPGLSSHPISAFVGDGLPPPTAVANLRNIFDTQSHVTADIGGEEILGLRAFRGLANGSCTLQNQGLFHFRRAPQHEEVATLGVSFSELEELTSCFFADTVCDDRVDILDVQRVLNQFNQACGGCQFNGDLDIVEDCAINILDVQSVLNRFGQRAPFTP